MKKHEINEDKEFETLLKNKMNELSESVDVFDKISSRAFPEKEPDFYEGESTVSDLEKISGRHKRHPVLKWTAAAAALVLCAGLLPQTALMNSLKANIGKDSEKKTYRSIISEMEKEITEYNYRTIDVPLDYYVKNDVLVTPTFACPFESGNKEGIMVRLYIKYCGTLPTNQVYAVEYCGDYADANFIAVAESGAEFSDEELDELMNSEQDLDDISGITAASVNAAFPADDHGQLNDGTGAVSAASFRYDSFYKHGSDISAVTTSVIYYRSLDPDWDGSYSYDILSSSDDDVTIMPKRTAMWKNVVQYSGKKIVPSEEDSMFKRKEIFLGDITDYSPHETYDPHVSFVTFGKLTQAANVIPKDKDYGREYALYTDSVKNTENELSRINVSSDNTILMRTLFYFPDNAYSLTTIDGNHILSLTDTKGNEICSFLNKNDVINPSRTHYYYDYDEIHELITILYDSFSKCTMNSGKDYDQILAISSDLSAVRDAIFFMAQIGSDYSDSVNEIENMLSSINEYCYEYEHSIEASQNDDSADER